MSSEKKEKRRRNPKEDPYHISSWGSEYFDVDNSGNIVVKPQFSDCPIIIKKVIDEMKEQNIELPAVIRFHDILRSQVKKLNETFKNTIDEAHYKGRFFGVYPIKVNQMREVVEEIIDAGREFDYGLEAGSKSELLAVLAYNTNPNSLTILNGYKDNDYLSLALLGTQLGRHIIIVIERFSEIEKMISLSQKYKISPLIGLRGKMSQMGKGRWSKSTGERAKFGLSSSELIQAFELLKKHNMDSSIKLFHFHVGSQVSDIRTIKAAISEGGRIYTQLCKMGAQLEYFDAGGGLGIDYDGSQSNTDSSINYQISEYAADIVYGLQQICDLENIPHPNIITESGRAITAHHSMVVTNVLDKISVSHTDFNFQKEEQEHHLVSNIRDMFEWKITKENFQEIYNETLQIKEQAHNAFKLGVISLKEKAKIETIYWKSAAKLISFTKDLPHIPEDILELKNIIAPQYLCNFSVFQSTADHWAIGQLLPVIPLTRLNEEPTLNCSIADITCDSDGSISQFISKDGPLPTIPIHELHNGEDYYIGLFLTGAYQDVMGDMHNLFGRLNEVHVYGDNNDPAGFYIEEIIHGHSSSHVLKTMQYNPESMAKKIKEDITKITASGMISPRQGVRWVDFYEACLTNYTYLKVEKKNKIS